MLLAMILSCLNLIMAPAIVFSHELTITSCQNEWLDLDSARHYLIELINKDRLINGLQPVSYDEVATIVGQQHSDDMALSKYVSHWDHQGRKPDQRYCQAGGQGAVSENVLVTHDFAPWESYRLAPEQRFRKADLKEIESLFFKEQPPNDGHHKNILNPNHNRVGIGLSLIVPGNRIVCTQEFVNQWGSFAQLPDHYVRGERMAVAGQFPKGVSLYSVDIYRDQTPQPMSTQELKATHSYSLPNESMAHYFPPPYSSPEYVHVLKTEVGESFSLNITPSQSWPPGLYYVMVWVKKTDSGSPVLASARTVELN